MARSRRNSTSAALVTLALGVLLGSSFPAAGGAVLPAEEAWPAASLRDADLPRPWAPRLDTAPLASPLTLNAGFGDYRGGHFHAGFDFGTGQQTGRPVFAPASGWIERARSSGVGYGRALYLRADDGRVLEFGHLDAFAGPLADYVENIKDSTARYEQDLWLHRGRFSVRAGETIAWTGQSGAGGPHLHFEIRRGDVAYHPLLAGLAVGDSVPPTLVDITLDPLDDRSLVEGRPGPYTVTLGGVDTVRAIGRFRAVVLAYDRNARRGARTTPWSVGMEWNGRRTECRFDSVSWATDMVEADYVYDAGQVVGKRGLMLWSPAGYRPRVLSADAPAGEEAGTIVIRGGDPPRTLVLWARDLAGGVVRRRLLLRARGDSPAAAPAWWRGKEPWEDPAIRFASLPGGFLRIGVPAKWAKRRLDLQVGDTACRATRDGGVWSATFSVPAEADRHAARLPLATRADGMSAPAKNRGGFVWARHAGAADAFELADESTGWRVSFPAGSLFEDATVLSYSRPARRQRGLRSVGRALQVEPSALPCRRPARISLRVPAGVSRDRIGLYRLDSRRWQWIGAHQDSVTRAVGGESRRLGCFALFRDEVAPRAKLLRPAATPASSGPYSRWAVEASVVEEGSGVDADGSYLEIDGRRVPTEWDPEAARLRWRPVKPPAPGAHAVTIAAADRAGNTSRARGSFRLER